MSHLKPTRWSALAVMGLLSGLITTAPGPATPLVTPSPEPMAGSSAGPTPSRAEPTAAPTPTLTTPTLTTPAAGPTDATPTTPTTPRPVPGSPSAQVVHQPRRSGGAVTPGDHRTTAAASSTGAGAANRDGSRHIDAAWMSYLPTPETGLKIFAAGLLALAVAIAGLAALAIRRRTY